MKYKDRIRRRLRGLHKKYLEFNHLTNLINLSVSRPVNLILMQKEISELNFSTVEKIRKIEICLAKMELLNGCENEISNIIVATLRELESENIDLAITFGMKYLVKYQDKRGLASLITVLENEGKQHLALDILEKCEIEWARKRLSRLRSSIGLTQTNEISFKENIEKSFLKNIGIDYLTNYNLPSIIIYGDIDMNVIDGSSVWLSSLTEALAQSNFQIHLLLKNNIKRDLLTNHIEKLPNVQIFAPEIFGLNSEQLTITHATDIIEVLDGIVGGYRSIILRGFDLCVEAGSRKSFWQRIWAYLTDYYTVDLKSGIVIEEQSKIKLNDLQHMVEYFLVQTKEIGDNLHKIGISQDKLRILPPMLPDDMLNINTNKAIDEVIRIGYCGKIAPLWGVKELIDRAEKISSTGANIEVHIIGDKIHKNTKDNPTFREDMQNILQNSKIVKWHGAVSRDKAVELLSLCDLGWCYRDIIFEKNTLELSTKLLEHLAINLPFVVVKNTINESLLGADYPYFVEKISDLDQIMKNINKDNLRKIDLSSKLNPHLISTIASEILIPLLDNNYLSTERKRVVIAGTDLKFIGHFESYLKKQGCIVKRDHWKWGEPEFIQRTKLLNNWGEFIWCEWNLANAVWYSNNKRANQKLVSRLHLQEVGARARRFQTQININNIDKILIVANHIIEEAKELFGWNDEKLHYLPNYVETDRLFNAKKDNSLKRIAIVGVVPERKRLDLALDLIENLRKIDDEWKLVVKGRLPHDYSWMMGESRRSELQYYDKQYSRIKKSKYLKGGVDFEGYTLTISEFYKSIGYVLSTSDFESFHYTIADGVSAGNFPIIWPWTGAAELYPNEWVVNNIDDATKKIIEYSKLAESQKIKYTTNRINFIKSNYDLEVILPKMADALFD